MSHSHRGLTGWRACLPTEHAGERPAGERPVEPRPLPPPIAPPARRDRSMEAALPTYVQARRRAVGP